MVDVREGETGALVWSFTYFFLILTSYYILRPIRDEMGVVGGVENLAWLFTGTLVGMLLLHPLYSSLVVRMPRRQFVPLTYRFFILNLVLFYLVFRAVEPEWAVWVGRFFFVWVSVFNLFVVSVFWSFMTDVYHSSQSKRLFGVLAVGGTLGAILGSSITSLLAVPFGTMNLLLLSGLFLELASRASGALGRREGVLAHAAAVDHGQGELDGKGEEVIGGGVLEGVGNVARSPYLLGIAGIMLFFTISTTFLYFQQADLTARIFGDDSPERTRFFANIDLVVNTLTLVTQLFVTGRVLKWAGVGFGLAFLPLVSVVGFGVLAVSPVLGVLVVLQVIRRAGNYAIQRPAREVLYTVLPRADKYKSKNFNDTFVYRIGDQIGAWSYTLVGALGLGFAGLSTTMVPFSAFWLALAVWLGVRYGQIQDRTADTVPTAGHLRSLPRRSEDAIR
jgi:AAA family ATP:ADP antiporter